MAGQLNIGTLLVRLLLDDKVAPGLEKTEAAVVRFNSKISSMAGNLDSMLTGALKRGATALAAMTAATLVTGATFEQQMSRVAAISGASAQELSLLTDEARRIGSETQFSATQAAQGMEALAQAGFSVQEIITATSDAMALAGATGLELNAATELVAATIQQFGLSASDAGRVADTLTTASQASLFSIEDLSVAMRYGGSVGAAFGLSLEETAAAMAQFRDIGLTGEQAGTNFRAMMEALANPTQVAREQIAALGLEMKDLDPTVRTMAEIMQTLGEAGMDPAESFAIFGTVAGANVARLSELFLEGKDTYEEMIVAFETGTGRADQTFARMADNVAGRFEQLRSGVEELFLTLYESLVGPTTRLLNGLIDRVDVLTRHADNSGKSIEDSANRVVDAILNLTDKLILLLPFVEELAVMMFAALVGAKGVVWVTQIVALANAFGITTVASLRAAMGAVYSFGAALASSTAGISLIIGLVAALAAGMFKLSKETAEAREEQQKLAAALDAQKQFAASTAKEQQQVAAALAKTQGLARLALSSMKDLTDIEKARFESVLKLTSVEALRAVKNGDMIESEGRLLLVNGQNLWMVSERTKATEKLVGSLESAIAFLDEETAKLNAGTIGLQAWQAAAAVVTETTGENITSTEDWLRVREVLRLRLEAESQSLNNLKNKVAVVTSETNAAAAAAGKQNEGLKTTAKTARETAEAQEQQANASKRQSKEADQAAEQFKKQKEAAEDMAASQKSSLAKATLEYERQIEQIEEWAEAGVDQQTIVEALQSAWIGWKGKIDAASASLKAFDDTSEEAFSTIDAAQESVEGALGSLEEMASRINVGSLLMASFGEATSQAANTVKKDLGQAVLDFFGQFKDAVLGVIGVVLDLSGVLDFAQVFKTSTEEMKTWREEYEALKAELDQKVVSGEISQTTAEKQLLAKGREKPLGPAAAAGQAAIEQAQFVTGLVGALPLMMSAIIQELPTLITAILTGVLGVVDAVATVLPDFIMALVLGLADFLEASPTWIVSIMSKMPMIVQAVVKALPVLVTAVIAAVPQLMFAFISQLPLIYLELALMAPNIIAAFIAEFPNMVEQLWLSLRGIAEDFGKTVLSILTGGFINFDDSEGGGVGGFLGTVGDAVGAFGKLFGGKGRNPDGIEWAPRTMATVIEPGEAVIDALSNWERLRTNLNGPGPIPMSSGGGGSSSTEVIVAFDGQVVDAAQSRSMERGRMPRLARGMRSGAGTKIGFTRGKGSVWP